jgi:hypothetical protein
MAFWKRSCNLLVRVSLSIILSLGSGCHKKRASTIPPLDLPTVSIGTFLEGMTIFPDFGQVGSPSTLQCLVFTSNQWSMFQEIDVRLRVRLEDFPFLILVHPTRP